MSGVVYEVRTPCEGAGRGSVFRTQSAGHSGSQTRLLGRPRMHAVHHAIQTAKHPVQVQTGSDKSFSTVQRHRLRSHGYKTVLQDCALLFSYNVTSLESVSNRPRFLGMTPVIPNEPQL